MSLLTRALLVCLFGLAPHAHAQVSGDTACIAAGKPDLRFKPQSALGYFVTKKNSFEGSFALVFFAEKLKPEEVWYWIASKTMSVGDKFQNKELELNAPLDKRMTELQKSSVSVWGEIKEHSKHKLEALPAVHELADFTGMQLTGCSNMGYLNAGLDEDKVAASFKALRFPLGGTGNHAADIDLNYAYKSSNSSANFSVRGKVPFYIVTD